MGITQTKLQEVKIILDSLKSRMGRRMMIGMRNKRGGKKWNIDWKRFFKQHNDWLHVEKPGWENSYSDWPH